MWGMAVKTTLYLPHELKAELEREALRRGLSQSEVIRRAIASAVRRPRPGIIEGAPFATHADEKLTGFGG